MTYKEFGTMKVFINGEVEKNDIRTQGNNGRYKTICYKGSNYYIHRLVAHLWLGLDLKDTKTQVDHIDGNRHNNSLSNLRLVTNRTNQQNQYKHRQGKLVGSYFHKASGKYMARCTWNGTVHYLGLHATESEAHQKYLKTLKELEQGIFKKDK